MRFLNFSYFWISYYILHHELLSKLASAALIFSQIAYTGITTECLMQLHLVKVDKTLIVFGENRMFHFSQLTPAY